VDFPRTGLRRMRLSPGRAARPGRRGAVRVAVARVARIEGQAVDENTPDRPSLPDFRVVGCVAGVGDARSGSARDLRRPGSGCARPRAFRPELHRPHASPNRSRDEKLRGERRHGKRLFGCKPTGLGPVVANSDIFPATIRMSPRTLQWFCLGTAGALALVGSPSRRSGRGDRVTITAGWISRRPVSRRYAHAASADSTSVQTMTTAQPSCPTAGRSARRPARSRVGCTQPPAQTSPTRRPRRLHAHSGAAREPVVDALDRPIAAARRLPRRLVQSVRTPAVETDHARRHLRDDPRVDATSSP
jgi:hypothetical protein